LLSSGPLNEARIHHCDELLEMDPAILPLMNVLRHSLELEALNAVLPFLRAHGVFQEDDLNIPHGGGVHAVLKRLQRSLDRVVAPQPPFTLAYPFRVIRTIRELREIGTTLNNCVRNVRGAGVQHWFRLADGSSVYVASDEQPMLAALRQIAPGLWLLDELHGPENAPVTHVGSTSLTDALHAAGIKLLDQEPARALSILCRRHELADLPDD
jgi:hypothetical protein